MIKRDIYLVCGVPGSGKSWVCSQLRDRFTYVAHDDHIGRDLAGVLDKVLANSEESPKPLLTDCPFAERELRGKLEALWFNVRPYVVIETPAIVAERYKKRTGREPSQATITRSTTIAKRAEEWQAPRGTSAEVLAMLMRVGASSEAA